MSIAGLKPSRESSGVRRSEETPEGRKPEGAMKWEVGARDRQHPGHKCTCQIASEISRGVRFPAVRARIQPIKFEY